jgi:hypothetical protein
MYSVTIILCRELYTIFSMSTATKTYTETKHIPLVTVLATKHENTAKIMTLSNTIDYT